MSETDSATIAKKSAYLVAQSVATMLISVVAFGLVARLLTQTEMGVTVALTLTLTIAQLLSDLGFSSGLTKYIAEYRGRNEEYSPLLISGIIVKLIMASLIALVCVVAAQLLSSSLLKSVEYSILFQLFSLHLLFAGLNATMNSVLLGLNEIREMAILNVLAELAGQVFAVTFLMYGFGLLGLIAGWILGDMVYLVPSSLIVAKRGCRMPSITDLKRCLWTLAKFSWPLFLTNMVVFLYSWFDRALLLSYAPLSEVAIYNVAFRAFAVLQTIRMALSTTLFPYYSEQYGKDKHGNIAMGVKVASRYVTLFFTPLAFGLMITANPAIRFFAGPLYSQGYVVLAILSFFIGITSVRAAFGHLLVVYNMTATVFVINIVMVGAAVSFSFVLLPFLGVTGMAFVRGITMIVSMVLTATVLSKRIRLEFDKEALWKSWCAAIFMCVAVGLVEWICFSHSLLPFYVVIGGISYALALRFLRAVNERDIELVRNLLGDRATVITKILKNILI